MRLPAYVFATIHYKENNTIVVANKPVITININWQSCYFPCVLDYKNAILLDAKL